MDILGRQHWQDTRHVLASIGQLTGGFRLDVGIPAIHEPASAVDEPELGLVGLGGITLSRIVDGPVIFARRGLVNLTLVADGGVGDGELGISPVEFFIER